MASDTSPMIPLVTNVTSVSNEEDAVEDTRFTIYLHNIALCLFECVYITREAIFSSSVYERRYSFTGISNKALTAPPVLNRRRSFTEWVGIKVLLAVVIDFIAV